MRRLTFPPLVIVVVALLASSAHAQAPITAPPLAATVSTCTIGATPADRLGVFEGAMPAASGARTLAMRFTLQSRTGDDAFHTLKASSFGAWQRSKPNVAGLVLDKRVEHLAAGVDYRVKVDFRWYARSGKVLKRATRTTAVCEQPDVRPDLRVTAITVSPTGGYDVGVLNHGNGDVETPFGLQLTVGGVVQIAPPRVAVLAEGSSTTIHVDGAACTTGTPLTATVDPDGVVDEPDKSDDVLAVLCP